MKESKVIFDTRKLAAEMMKNLSAEQTNRLIEYAKQTILEIGDKIQTYHSRNHMYRTGHLLRSLCCGVSYDGKLVYSGFYGDITLQKQNHWQEGETTNAYLHEWTPEEYQAFQVDGRHMAQNYIQRYGSAGSGNKTWRVFFAILAPYWGYWESGFTLIHGGAVHYKKNGEKSRFRGAQFKQFAVMTEFYDKVGKDLKPAKVKFQITKDMNYTKSYHVKSIKGHKGYVRGTIERRYDNWMKKHK